MAEHTLVRLKQSEKEKLKKIAEKNKRSMARQIEYWIERYGNRR